MVRTVGAALGPTTTVRVQAMNPGQPSIERPDPRDGRNSDDAWVVVDWQDPKHCTTQLHGYLPHVATRLDRSITFSEADPDDERGRTIGFVISAMFASALPPVPARADTQRVAPAITQPQKTKFWAATIAASAAGIGDADSFGAVTSFEYGRGNYRIGVFGGARFGTIPHAQASTRYIDFGVSGNARLLPAQGSTWVGVSAYAGTSNISATHLSEDDAYAVKQSAWMPLLTLSARVTQELSSNTWLFLDGGPEFRFGAVDIYVHAQSKARIPAWVAATRLGLLARF